MTELPPAFEAALADVADAICRAGLALEAAGFGPHVAASIVYGSIREGLAQAMGEVVDPDAVAAVADLQEYRR